MSYTPIPRKQAVLSLGQGIRQILLTNRSFVRCQAHCDKYAQLYILPNGGSLENRFVDPKKAVYKATYRVPKSHPIFSRPSEGFAEIELYIESSE